MALHKRLLPLWKRAPEKLSGEDLAAFLIKHPEQAGKCRLDRLHSAGWCKLLCSCPQFASECDFNKIDPDYLTELIRERPEFFDRVPKKKLKWCDVLCKQPQLFKYCPLSRRFTLSEWCCILHCQPSLADCADLGKYQPFFWADLISAQKLLAPRCPWRKVSFDERWRRTLLLHPETVLAYKSEWKKYYNMEGLKLWEKAVLLSMGPHLESMVDFSEFPASYWGEILEKQPQFIKYCPVEKIFGIHVPLGLISVQPGLAEYFNWENMDAASSTSLDHLLKIHPQLICKAKDAADAVTWEYLLSEYPGYFPLHPGERFSFCDNTAAFIAADIWDFETAGLDSICNSVWKHLEQHVSSPEGLFAVRHLSVEEFLIKSLMDRVNAKPFLAERLRSDWAFIEKIHDADPEAIHRFLPRSEVPFLWCAAAPGTLYRKYLEYTGKAAEFRDKKGNTLLHTALLRGLFEGRTAFFESSHHSRECYDHLIEKGCSPETKNNAGVSCNALLAQFRARREQFRSS